MNLVDSCGWLEYYGDGPNGPFFAPAIEDRESLLVPTVCILEVFKRILQFGQDEEAALVYVGVMREGMVVELDEGLALNAAALGIRMGLSLADSIILATARAYDATIWTQDADFKDIAGVKYVEKR
jgi:toxin FitB